MARVMKSGPSRKAVYLRFINKTSRNVDVIWLDYTGTTRNYGVLEPSKHFDIHTYEGHPWVCEDTFTKTRMLLNKKETFYPQILRDLSHPYRDHRHHLHLVSNHEHYRDGMKRELVYITLPVISLLELSAEVVIRNVRCSKDVRSLKIPKRMQDSLLTLQHSAPFESYDMSPNILD